MLQGGKEGIKVSKGFAVGDFELFDRLKALLHNLHKWSNLTVALAEFLALWWG